jgi:hypothetical protein
MSEAHTLFGSVTRDIRPLYTPKKNGLVYLFGIPMPPNWPPTNVHVLRVSFHVDRQILVGIRTNTFKCRREYGGVGFICANYSSYFHLLKSKPTY